MKRMLLTALMASALALAAPGVASAHQGRRHGHAGAHKRHRHARHITFGRLSQTSATGSAQSAPASPSSEPAGKVLSFEGGLLKITLADGSLVSGKVTEQTELECRSAAAGGEDQDEDDQGEDRGDALMAHASDDGGDQGQQGDDNEVDEPQQACTTAALVPGAVVGAAELRIGSAGAVWEKVELDQ